MGTHRKMVGSRRSAGAVRSGSGRLWVGLFILFAFAMFYVWSRYYATQMGYRLSEGTLQEKKLLEERRGLELELGRLRSLDRVETIARRELGLTDPRADQIVFVRTGEKP